MMIFSPSNLFILMIKNDKKVCNLFTFNHKYRKIIQCDKDTAKGKKCPK